MDYRLTPIINDLIDFIRLKYDITKLTIGDQTTLSRLVQKAYDLGLQDGLEAEEASWDSSDEDEIPK